MGFPIDASTIFTSLDPRETSEQTATIIPPGERILRPDPAARARHARWHDQRASVYDALASLGTRSEVLDRFASCGSNAWVVQNTADPADFRIASNLCKHRWCIPCQRDRSRDLAARVARLFDKGTTRFVTLTLATASPRLADEVTRLYDAFRALRRRVWWKRKVTGGVAFLEVKWSGKSNRWHPHLHVLVQGAYMPQPRLAALWHAVTKDSYIVDIRLVRDASVAAHYVTKYASKSAHDALYDHGDVLAEAIQAMHGKRTVIPFGILRKNRTKVERDNTTYRPVARLTDLLRHARHGDERAAFILALLKEHHPWIDLPEEFPPDT